MSQKSQRDWRKELNKSGMLQKSGVPEYETLFGMKQPNLQKKHTLIVVPKGKIVDVRKLSKEVGVPLGVSSSADAVGAIKDPVVIFVQVQNLAQIDTHSLKQSIRSGFVPLWKDGPKTKANGTLWVAIDSIPDNLDELKQFMTAVKIDEKEDIWVMPK